MTSIACALPRTRVALTADVVAVCARVEPLYALDVVLSDGTGELACCFSGRRSIPGIAVGTRLRVAGRVVRVRGQSVLLNPAYELVDPDASSDESS
jgi:hypothetical protein